MNIGFKFSIITLFLIGCQSQKTPQNTENIVYTSDSLVIKQLTPNTYQHISFLQTETFGNVPCNGMIVINKNEAIVIDTPVNYETSYELINWISKDKNAEIIAVVPTHFHDDCLGGLTAFEKNNIPPYANTQTIELAKANAMNIPQNGFNDIMTLPVGSIKIDLTFFGEGHTRDNIVAYVENDKVLFGGCLVKELNAGKGYLGDANVDEWSKTIEKISDYYPNLQLVIPGHGKAGNKELLNFTAQLFKN
jgi:metallo-beta-lactamase class B